VARDLRNRSRVPRIRPGPRPSAGDRPKHPTSARDAPSHPPP